MAFGQFLEFSPTDVKFLDKFIFRKAVTPSAISSLLTQNNC